MWRWKPRSDAAGGVRGSEIRLGQMNLTLVLRKNVDEEDDLGFDVMLSCRTTTNAPATPGLPPTASTTRTSCVPSTARTTSTSRAAGRADLEVQAADAIRE